MHGNNYSGVYQIMRRKTRNFFMKNTGIGSEHPVTIQSMCNTRTADIDATLAQINELAANGCDIIRVSADSEADCRALQDICRLSPLPVIADIQFSAASALNAIKANVAGIRVNPGIINDAGMIKSIADAARSNNTVIRVGANAGSLKPHEVNKYIAEGMDKKTAVANALCQAVLDQCAMLEKSGVKNIKAALNSSNIQVTLEAYRKFAAMTDYPLHLGLTEAGTPGNGEIKSAVCIGTLLNAGIGDTIRVSLTADTLREVRAAAKILEACGMKENSVEIISCPTCGRTEIDLIGLTEKVEELVAKIQNSGNDIMWKKIAVMGCPVNGPGESRDADIGIAGSKNGQLIIFRKGKVTGAYNEKDGFAAFAKLISGIDCQIK